MKPFLHPYILVASALALAAAAVAAGRPNLLVIQTDEHNFRTLGCYRALLSREQAFIWGPGVAVETPHIDGLAREGAIVERFYATSPVCTPSRASLVAGRYPQNTGAINNGAPLRDDVVTFAEVLWRNGYATGYAGKWHLDGSDKPGWAPKRKFGFEDNRYMFNRGHWKKLGETAAGPRVAAVNEQGEPTYDLAGADPRTFTTDFLADRTIEFIQANKDKPFCYFVSFPDPHGPNVVRAPYDTMFANLKFEQPRSAQSEGENLPAYAATLRARFNSHQMSQYFGMVKCIDDNVGRILDALRGAGVLEHTIVVFTSDHGDLCGEHGRNNKGVPMEASSRIPFLIRAPGKIKPGTVVREVLATVDFKPTILSLMGISNPAGDEGRDAARLFTAGVAPKGWEDAAFLRIGRHDRESDNTWMAVFTPRHKLVVAPADAPSLFDLERDPDELRNLFAAPAERETVRQLARQLAHYGRTYNEPLMQSSAVRADLEWAMEGKGEYRAAARDAGTPGHRGNRNADDDEN